MKAVYPLLFSGSKWQHNELRYSLRSLSEFVGIEGVVIISDKLPDWCQGVEHIDIGDTSGRKAINVLKKLDEYTRQAPGESFLFMNDDFFITPGRIIKLATATYPHYYRGNLGDRLKELNPKYKYYRKLLKDTENYLKSEGVTTTDFAQHVPAVIDSDLFREVIPFEKIYAGKLLSFRSIYGNFTPPETWRQRKFKKWNVPVPELEWRNFRRRMEKREIFSIGDAFISPGAKKIMNHFFPEPSKYEK